MGIMTGQATASGHRGVDIGFREIRLVVALETKFGDRGGKRQLAFFLCMRGCVAGRAALFPTRILAERGVDDPLRRHFLVTVDAGLLRGTGVCRKAEEQNGEKNDTMQLPQNHAAL